ncbi:MAG: phage terminase large subunit [Candidatus Sumerlaeota bacterium]
MHIKDLTIAGFLDAATGRGSARKQGDYAAVATVGRDPQGALYVLDIWLERAAPSRQVAVLFDLHERWNYALFGFETNCFQQLLLLPIEEERKRRRAAGRPWQLPLQQVHHAENKQMRLARLEPLITHGWMRFSRRLPQQFWAQLEGFPRAAHDDALDALEGAVALLQNMTAPVHRIGRRDSQRRLRQF